MQDAAAEAARIARGAKGSADNDLDSKSSDEKKAGHGSGYVEELPVIFCPSCLLIKVFNFMFRLEIRTCFVVLYSEY